MLTKTPSAIRRALVRAAALLLLPVAASGILGSGSPPDSAPDAADDAPVYLMRITGTIDLGLAPYVDRVVDEAERAGAAALIIEIDTPGGRLDAALQIRDSLIDTDLRTIAVVDATAFSAGALIAIASDEIYMTPGSAMGAATPVIGDTGEVADEKTISAVRATFESTAEENGRDPLVAAAMVDTSVEIEGLVSGDRLLTLTVSDALRFGYSDGSPTDVESLLADLGLADSDLVELRVSLAERVVRFLTNPVVAGLLLLGGFLLVIGDLFSGGVGLASIGGFALLAIFFWGHLLAGLAGWEDIVLVVAGIALIAVEVFVLPGFGVAGILGLAALGGGAFMSMIYRDFDFVTTDDLWRAGLTVGFTLLAAVVGVVLLVALVARRGPPSGLVLSARMGSGATIGQRSTSGWLGWFGADDRLEPDRVEHGTSSDAPGETSMLGCVGVAVSDLRPGGIVEIDGRRVDVVTSGEFVAAGEPVEVIRDERYRRVVRRRAGDALN